MSCENVIKLAIPAIRAAIAEQLISNYGFTQFEIARHLGITQSAVSKYVNNRYSSNINSLKGAIEKTKAEKEIIDMIISKKSAAAVSKKMDSIATSKLIFNEASKLGWHINDSKRKGRISSFRN
jgi:predicted transcriptional regulator